MWHKFDVSQIFDKLNYVLLMNAISGEMYHPVDILDRTIVSNVEQLDKVLSELKYNKIFETSHYLYSGEDNLDELGDVHTYELEIRPNFVILFDITQYPEERFQGSIAGIEAPIKTK